MAQPSMSDGFVLPHEQERVRSGREKVLLFYVGWKYHKATKGKPPPVVVKTIPIEMPALGESFRLDEVLAEDLIFRTRWQGKPIFMREDEGGREAAEMLRTALREGTDLDQIDLDRMQARRLAESHLSDEDLVALMRQRKLKIKNEWVEQVSQQEEEAATIPEDVPEEETEPADESEIRSVYEHSARSAGRPPKKRSE